MPRGTPKKATFSRVAAAVNAMKPFGFEGIVVRSKVKRLLKEYGGEENYPFIEADAYKVLLEALIEDSDGRPDEETSKMIVDSNGIPNGEPSTMGGLLLEDKRDGGDALAIAEPMDAPQIDLVPARKSLMITPLMIDFSKEETDDFVTLTAASPTPPPQSSRPPPPPPPSSPPLPPPPPSSPPPSPRPPLTTPSGSCRGGSGSQSRKRSSRWDLAPEELKGVMPYDDFVTLTAASPTPPPQSSRPPPPPPPSSPPPPPPPPPSSPPPSPCPPLSTPSGSCGGGSGSQPRKRKSRWDWTPEELKGFISVKPSFY